MKIALLGSGNVATHLSKALIKAGYPVMQVWSRKENNAIDLALQIGANSISDCKEIKDSIDVVILAVTDDAIENVASQIPQKEGRLVLHTSGTTPLNVLEKYFDSCGVLYPLQTFSKTADLDFQTIPICIEANNIKAENQLELIAGKISSKVEKLDSPSRAILHISAVFACNFTNYFYSVAQELLEGVQLNFDLLRPLIQETADKAMLNLPFEVQTGPAKRNDQLTMNKHLALLKDNSYLQGLYSSISQGIVKMYQPNLGGE
ncbi:MAG: DUF2520 domain-containing protein [Pelobium sp.]